jgi:hypothetical protein
MAFSFSIPGLNLTLMLYLYFFFLAFRLHIVTLIDRVMVQYPNEKLLVASSIIINYRNE